jgi:hypothetical protein
MVAGWLDEEQLEAVDATETPYHRVLLPGEAFPMVMPSGERLDGCYLYVHRRGVLADEQGVPLRAAEQGELLTGLLARSARLRELFGDDPATFVARAGADEALRDVGTKLFEDSGWVVPQPAFDPYVSDDPAPCAPRYEELSPLDRAATGRSPVG